MLELGFQSTSLALTMPKEMPSQHSKGSAFQIELLLNEEGAKISQD